MASWHTSSQASEIGLAVTFLTIVALVIAWTVSTHHGHPNVKNPTYTCKADQPCR